MAATALINDRITRLVKARDELCMFLLDWYYEDEILDTQTADWSDNEKMTARYHQLNDLGVNPLDSEWREQWQAWKKGRP